MGSDTCGSIRIPAAHNNLFGLRGTQGLTSRHGIVPLSHTQDIGGPLTRSARDLAIVMDAIAGFDPADLQTAASHGQLPGSYVDGLRSNALAGARIGIATDLLALEPGDAEVASHVRGALDRMANAGAEVRPVSIPDLDQLLSEPAGGFIALVHDFRFDIDAWLADHPNAPVRDLQAIVASRRFHPDVAPNLAASAAVAQRRSPVYLEALAQREMLRLRIVAAMLEAGVDALAYPTIRRTAATIGQPQPGTNCRLSANSGLPAVSLPIGFSAAGLPVGMDLLTRAWGEPLLLDLALAWDELATPRRTPDIID